MISKKKIKIKDYYNYLTDYDEGVFFLVSDNGHIHGYGCREEFADEWGEQKTIGFWAGDLNIKLFNNFFGRIHKTLKLKTPIVIHKTNIAGAILIDLPAFWIDNQTRRSLLTLFIRGAIFIKNNKESIETVLKRYYLASDVLKAIKHFLNGNVYPTYQNIGHGFYSKFKDASNAYLYQSLVKKKNGKISKYLIPAQFEF